MKKFISKIKGIDCQIDQEKEGIRCSHNDKCCRKCGLEDCDCDKKAILDKNK